MPISPCQTPSNSGQNRSKGRQNPIKSDQTRAQFVMPILTFWGVTPSGASAKADFALRKGKKARFGGPKWRPEKLSTIRKSYPQFPAPRRPGVRDCRRRGTPSRSGRRPGPAGCTRPRLRQETVSQPGCLWHSRPRLCWLSAIRTPGGGRATGSEIVSYGSTEESKTRTFFQLDGFSWMNILCRAAFWYSSWAALSLNTKKGSWNLYSWRATRGM